MAENKLHKMLFTEVYHLYVAKAERKGRAVNEVNEIICWLTGYSEDELKSKLSEPVDMESFFVSAPSPNPNRNLIKGSICGVKISDIEEPIMKDIRSLEKLIDELAKGKPMDKILK